jgi:hypothetical protein
VWIIPTACQAFSAYAQDTVASKEDLSSPDLSIELSLMSRSKPTPLPTWLRRWNKGGWHLSSTYRWLITVILKPCQKTSKDTSALDYREVIEDLEGLGYSTTWGIFSAAEVGAPHQRKRVYILGSDTNCRDGSAKQERQHKGSKELDGCCNGRLAASGSENMANSDSEQQRRDSALDKNTQRQTISGTKPSWRGSDLADSSSTRGAARLSRPEQYSAMKKI